LNLNHEPLPGVPWRGSFFIDETEVSSRTGRSIALCQRIRGAVRLAGVFESETATEKPAEKIDRIRQIDGAGVVEVTGIGAIDFKVADVEVVEQINSIGQVAGTIQN